MILILHRYIVIKVCRLHPLTGVNRRFIKLPRVSRGELDPIDIYIGSTTRHYLSDRFRTHKDQARDGYDGNGKRTPFLQYMYEVGIDNFDIVWIKNVPWVKNTKELESEEFATIQEYIDKGCYKVWNVYTSEEARSEYISQSRKEYFENNPEAFEKFKTMNFKYGSIYKENNNWCFRWVNNGKQECKAFSEDKYRGRAKEFVLAYQKKIYPQLMTDEDEDPDKILDDIKYYNINPGCISKTEKAWTYIWINGNGERMSKTYTISKFGAEQAEKLVKEHQAKKIAFEMLKKFANK